MFATATHMRVDSATRELASYVSKVKMDPEVRRSVMTFGDIIDRENRYAVHNAKVEAVLELLEEVGDVPDSVSETLEQTTDMEYLKNSIRLRRM